MADEKELKAKLKAYHKESARHVLVLEADLPEDAKRHLFHYADLERKAGNELVSIMRKRYEQLLRTKKYRKLKKLYLKNKDKADGKAIAAQLLAEQQRFLVTWDFCRKAMIPIGKKYGLGSIFALTKAEDIWRGVEKCLYSDGKRLRFSRRGDLPILRAKQINRGIVIATCEGKLQFGFDGLVFNPVIRDRFEEEEVSAVLGYLADPENKDKLALEGKISSTYRPCYASLVPKSIRGKLRCYVHIAIEGTAKPKYNRNGTLRHKKGKGIVGTDIGTQTIAYTSDSEVGLKNLAERGPSISRNESKERLLHRAMDRSRRATNPQNYSSDGTIKKGPKTWVHSNRYRRLQYRYSELSRKNSVNRHLSINEEVNHLCTLGDVFVTEEKNAKKLQKKANKTAVNAKGRINRKKRFGRSIKNRCPGYFQAQAERKFKTYIEVPRDYRASQYDHTSDAYVKKKLSERMFCLSDGTRVQRDWYSSFLLYSIDIRAGTIDRDKCTRCFEEQLSKEQELIDRIKKGKIKVFNSGIRVYA